MFVSLANGSEERAPLTTAGPDTPPVAQHIMAATRCPSLRGITLQAQGHCQAGRQRASRPLAASPVHRTLRCAHSLTWPRPRRQDGNCRFRRRVFVLFQPLEDLVTHTLPDLLARGRLLIMKEDAIQPPSYA